jgi:hypothetical protein
MKRPKRQGPCKVETTLQNPSPVAPRLHHDTTGVSHSTYTKDETTDERRRGIHATRLGRVWYTLKSEHRRNFTVAKRLPRLNAEERGHHQKTTMVKPALDPVADTESKEGRIKFEEENDYYACGINGCILRDHHQGACIFPDMGSRRRSRNEPFIVAVEPPPPRRTKAACRPNSPKTADLTAETRDSGNKRPRSKGEDKVKPANTQAAEPVQRAAQQQQQRRQQQGQRRTKLQEESLEPAPSAKRAKGAEVAGGRRAGAGRRGAAASQPVDGAVDEEMEPDDVEDEDVDHEKREEEEEDDDEEEEDAGSDDDVEMARERANDPSTVLASFSDASLCLPVRFLLRLRDACMHQPSKYHELVQVRAQRICPLSSKHRKSVQP